MFKIKSFIFISLLLSLNLTFGQWVYTQSLPMFCQFSNSTLGVVNFLTENSGMYSYSCYLSPSSGNLVILKGTINGGGTWNTLSSQSAPGHWSHSLHTVKHQNTYIYIYYLAGSKGIIKTFDDGATWSYLSLPTCGFLRDFSAVDTSNYYGLSENCNGYQFISKYSNGNLYYKLDSISNIDAFQLFFADTISGYIASDHKIYKTNLGGVGWTNVFNDSTIYINRIYFSSPNVGYAVGNSGKIIKTWNGGISWQNISAATVEDLKSLYFINDSIGYVGGDGGTILKTINGGLTWQDQSINVYSINKIFFVNDSVGFALAGNSLWKTIQKINNYEINDFIIYPNPTHNFLFLSLNQQFLNSKIIIRNVLGAEIYSYGIHSLTEGTNIIDIRNLSSGIYFVEIIHSEGFLSKKFIRLKN